MPSKQNIDLVELTGSVTESAFGVERARNERARNEKAGRVGGEWVVSKLRLLAHPVSSPRLLQGGPVLW